MYKKVLILFLTISFYGCSSFKNPNVAKNQYGLGTKYTLNYPPDWYSFDWHGNLNFAPKKIRNSKLNLYNNNLSIINFSDFNKGKSLEELIEKLNSSRKKKQKVYEIKTIDVSNEKYVQEITKEWSGITYKALQYYYKKNDKVFLLSYSFDISVYNEYLDEAKVIFNSFKFID